MEQKKKEGSCNTRSKTPSRSRNYCFTLNNYSEEDVKMIPTLGADYIFQEETGESGTPHLQGILMFKNAVSFSKLKKMLPTAHLEVSKNKIASMRYCSKNDTRTGVIYANVEIPRDVGTAQTQKSLSKDELKKIAWRNFENEMKKIKISLAATEELESKFTDEENLKLGLGYGKF